MIESDNFYIPSPNPFKSGMWAYLLNHLLLETKPAHLQTSLFLLSKRKGDWWWVLTGSTALFWKSYKTSFSQRRWWDSKAPVQLQQQELSATVVPRLEFLLHACRGQFSSGALPALPEGKAVILLPCGACYFVARVITVLDVISNLLLPWAYTLSLRQNKNFLSWGFLCHEK